MTNLLDVTYGKESFDNSNASVSVFAVPCDDYNSFDSEIMIDSAHRKDDISVNRQTQPSKQSAWATDARADLGSWTQCVYQCAEGMIFKIFAHKHSGHGQRTMNVAQFIRIRADGPYQEIKIKLTGHPKARKQYVVIKGRFDILSLEQARKMGVKVLPQYANTYNPGDVARVMEIKVIEKAKAPASVIRDRVRRRKDGEQTVQQIKRKVRTLDLSDDD